MRVYKDLLRVLVTGGRNYGNYLTVCKVLNTLDPAEVVHGGARGADSLAGRWARSANRREIICEADWAKHGRAAGIIRNKEMLNVFTPDIVVVFPGGRGTAHMRSYAIEKGYAVYVVNEEKSVLERRYE